MTTSVAKRCRPDAFVSLLMAAVLALSCAGCTGCQRHLTAYHIEVRPLDDGFTRSVELRRHADGEAAGETAANAQSAATIRDDDRKLLTGIYGVGEYGRDVVRFEAKFDEEIPADVGAGGVLVRTSSELGDTYHYSERMRGGFPSYERIAAVHDNLDQLIHWLVDWLGKELEGQAGVDELCAFVDGKGRTDAHDMLLLLDQFVRQSNSWSEEKHLGDFGGPLVLLIDRGYFTHAELARWTLTYQDLDEKEVPTIVLRCIATACGLPHDAPAITFLGDPEAWSESFKSYLKGLPEYADLVAAKRAAGEGDEVHASELFEPVVDFVGELFVSGLGGTDEVTLVLHTVEEPQDTNGQWDEETLTVRWSSSIPPRDLESISLPLVARARWYRPDEQRQRQLFGRVVFQGESLANYFQWRRSLDEEAADAWGRLLDRMGQLSADERRRAIDDFCAHWPPGVGSAKTFQQIADALIQGKIEQ